MNRSRALLLLVLAIAFWPVGRWYVMRMTDGSDEPWGILALLIALAFALKGHRSAAPPKNLVAIVAVLGIYLATLLWLPPLLQGCLMMAAFALALPTGAGAPGIRGLLLLSLPVMASAQFFAGFPLRVIAAKGAATLLQISGWDVSASGAALLWQGDSILVDAPCSGVRMLWVGMVMFCVGAARVGLQWRPFLVGSVAAVAIIVAANAVRCALVFVEEAGIAAVPGGWHSGVGLAVFAATGFLLLALAGKLRSSRWQSIHYFRYHRHEMP